MLGFSIFWLRPYQAMDVHCSLVFFIFDYFILQAIILMKQFSSTDPRNTNYLTFVTFLSG
jgi:hypothetical protein